MGEDQMGFEKNLKWGTSEMEENGSVSNKSSIGSAGSSCSSSSDMADQEEVTSSSSSLSNSQGPLYELSDLMAQLPMKKGLSKFYNGKCQSYTSLTSVRSIEDLMKKERPHNKRLKVCSSHGEMGQRKKIYSPKATISKKAPKSNNRGFSFLSSLGKRKGPNSVATSTRPPISLF